MDEAETRFFFQMIDRLSMRDMGSTILTSNKDISDWSEFFADMDALECTLDRLCGNALCISFAGDTYSGKGRTNVSLDFDNPIIIRWKLRIILKKHTSAFILFQN